MLWSTIGGRIMDEIRKLWIVLIIAAPFWVIGLWLQKVRNTDPAPGYSVEAKGWWVWLLGLRPGRGKRVYLGAAFYQIWALMYLIVGFLASWIWDMKTLGIITLAFLLAGPLLMWLAEKLIVRFWNRQ